MVNNITNVSREFFTSLLTCIAWCNSEHLKVTGEEMSKLMESRREAEQQVNAAKVKMDVLSTYFKEKEKELNRFLLFLIGVSVFEIWQVPVKEIWAISGVF